MYSHAFFIQVGDQLIAVDGVDIRKMLFSQVCMCKYTSETDLGLLDDKLTILLNMSHVSQVVNLLAGRSGTTVNLEFFIPTQHIKYSVRVQRCVPNPV